LNNPTGGGGYNTPSPGAEIGSKVPLKRHFADSTCLGYIPVIPNSNLKKIGFSFTNLYVEILMDRLNGIWDLFDMILKTIIVFSYRRRQSCAEEKALEPISPNSFKEVHAIHLRDAVDADARTL